MDESVFVFDSVVRAVWALKGSKPLVLATGSHQKSYVFGALAHGGRQMFRQYDAMNGAAFIKFLKQLRIRFRSKNLVLFLDKAAWHRRKKDVKEFLDKNRRWLSVEWFPTCCPELNPVEECWKQGKDKILGCRMHRSFDGMRHGIAEYFRTRRFKLDMVNYLCP